MFGMAECWGHKGVNAVRYDCLELTTSFISLQITFRLPNLLEEING